MCISWIYLFSNLTVTETEKKQAKGDEKKEMPPPPSLPWRSKFQLLSFLSEFGIEIYENEQINILLAIC